MEMMYEAEAMIRYIYMVGLVPVNQCLPVTLEAYDLMWFWPSYSENDEMNIRGSFIDLLDNKGELT